MCGESLVLGMFWDRWIVWMWCGYVVFRIVGVYEVLVVDCIDWLSCMKVLVYYRGTISRVLDLVAVILDGQDENCPVLRSY